MSNEEEQPELGNGTVESSSAEFTPGSESVVIPPRAGEEAPQFINSNEHDIRGANAINEGIQRSSSGRCHVSSSLSRRGALWPQTFGRQMEIYSRSPSGRIQGEVCEADSYVDRISNETGDIESKETLLLHPQWKDPLKEPLLKDSCLKANVEGKSSLFPAKGHKQGSVVNGTAIGGEYQHEVLVEGSSFFQACLNGTNVLAGVGILSTPYALAEGGAFEGVGFSHTGTLVNFSGLPVAVGICAFCFCGHAVFPSIYRSMKDKTQFSKVLIICFTAVTVLYGAIAAFGYKMFGEDLESQVTLNLPSTLVSSRIAIWIILVNPFAKFALTITPLAVALEEFLPWTPKSKQFMVGAICIRSLLVFSTIIVALAIPFFGLMMAFIGSFLSITVAVILPCLCYLRIYGLAGGISSAELSTLYLVVFVGIITGFIGTYSAVRGIIGSIHDRM